MKVVYEYSHLGGSEILKVHYPQIENEIYTIISKIKATRTKKSKEKTMMGKMLFSPKDMNQQFKVAFAEQGFSEMRDTYTISIPDNDIQPLKQKKV